MFYLGCSGWSYHDWVGPFYPTRKTDKLDFYSRSFNTVEINTTFYRTPEIGSYTRWMEKVHGEDFRFSVKFPGEVTHKQLMGDIFEAGETAVEFEKKYLVPAAKKGKLAAVLLQLPPYFTIRNTHRLLDLLGSLSTSAIRYFVEPRHETLYDSREFAENIRNEGAGIVEIDGPERILRKISSEGNSFYMRLHGRNYRMWNTKTENPSDRYDYEYSGRELASISGIIREGMERYEDAFIYFNNHPQGKAPRNAISLKGLLGLGSRDPQARLM